MSVALGSALVCCSNRRATATRAVGAVGHDDLVAGGFGDEVGDGAGLDVTCGAVVVVAVGLGLGVCWTGGELCVVAGVGATGPNGPDGVGDGDDTGGGDGVLAAVFFVPPFVIAPATATPAIAATAVPRISKVALRVLIRDIAERRRGGRRTGFWRTDPA